jgi:hypothetical protein
MLFSTKSPTKFIHLSQLSTSLNTLSRLQIRFLNSQSFTNCRYHFLIFWNPPPLKCYFRGPNKSVDGPQVSSQTNRRTCVRRTVSCLGVVLLNHASRHMFTSCPASSFTLPSQLFAVCFCFDCCPNARIQRGLLLLHPKIQMPKLPQQNYTFEFFLHNSIFCFRELEHRCLMACQYAFQAPPPPLCKPLSVWKSNLKMLIFCTLPAGNLVYTGHTSR